MEDKRVWIKWMELRVNSDVEAIKTPTGYIPYFKDIKRLFKEILTKDYLKEDYLAQFTIRIPENFAKIERIMEVFKKASDTPDVLFDELEEQRKRLEIVRAKFGDYVNPAELIDE